VRLWSLHPKYLDSRGLVALWREGLLAQAVLKGKTRGYRHHPQLERFLGSRSSAGLIAQYLRTVCEEAANRGYRFDATKIGRSRCDDHLSVTRGQLDYEWNHLLKKLRARDPRWLTRWSGVARPEAHPLFRACRGGVAHWEKRT
jgi:hypothetical protein